MSDPVLSQLVSVEDGLAEQVETLEAKLTQLRAQRQGLRTVIDMFQDPGDESVAVSTASLPAKSKPTTKKSAAKKSSSARTARTAKSGKAATKKAASKVAAGTKSSRTSKAAKTPSRRKKKDGRAATWQKYVQSVYRDTALPEAVSSVLRSQPSEVFTIADVMSSIFTEDMPRTSFLKARNRISNILSAGARDGTWYRGRNGRYSQSESVTKIK